MGCLFVHLSDLHLDANSSEPLDRIDTLCDAIANEANRAKRIFLIFSGDLTWSGKETEAFNAIAFVERLKSTLTRNPSLEVEVLIVPGNHDCDFDKETAVRKTLVEGIIEKGLSATIDDDIIEQCISVQKNVLQIKDYFESPSNRVKQNSLASLHTYSDGPFRVTIRCLNTAWLSRLKDQPGRIVIPPAYLPDTTPESIPVINVLVLHHPLHWLNPDQMREIRLRCEAMNDIIIQGHEHESAASQRREVSRPETTYLDGGIFHNPSDSKISTFNTLAIQDQIENAYEVVFTKFAWLRDHYDKDMAASGTTKIRLKGDQPVAEVSMQAGFRKMLDDPGANYTHPRVGQLKHGDIFIYPDLRAVSFNPRRSGGRVTENVSASEILHYDEHSPNRAILIGQQKAGRTALLRQLAKDAYSKGMIPLWLEGSDMTSSKAEQIDKKVAEAFHFQYESREEHLLEQHADTKKLIIIDNLDRSKLSTKSRLTLIDVLADLYKHVLISASDTFEIEEMSKADGSSGKSLQESYEVFQLMEFGNLLRAKLIRKWVLLGQEATIETNDLYREIDQAKALVDSVIGLNLVPSLPFFLLTILQTYEATSVHDLKYSSYGYYYEFLIIASMQQLSLKPDQMDAYQNYMSELAFRMFKSKNEAMGADAMKAFETTYAFEYRLYEDVETIRRSLSKINILSEKGSAISFRYRYIYYFFVAKYLSTHIFEAEAKQIVLNMASHPHVATFANILILLTYLSKEPYIVDSILETAKKVFEGLADTRLEEDISFFNSLTDVIPELVLQSIKTEEARDAMLRAEDKSESEPLGRNEATPIADDGKEVSELDFIAQVNLASKLTEILGQIAKSYYGSTKHERKIQIIGEACSAMLRTLTGFFNFVQQNKEQLVSEVVEILKQHKLADLGERERIIGFTKSFIFQVSGAVTYAFIKKIARFVGSKSLSPSIREFLETKGTVSAKLIDNAIKLDYFGDFPFMELSRLGRDIEHNTLAYTVLRSLVINHLYMFEVSYKDRQRICQTFGITMADTRKIDFISRERKTG